MSQTEFDELEALLNSAKQHYSAILDLTKQRTLLRKKRKAGEIYSEGREFSRYASSIIFGLSRHSETSNALSAKLIEVKDSMGSFDGWLKCLADEARYIEHYTEKLLFDMRNTITGLEACLGLYRSLPFGQIESQLIVCPSCKATMPKIANFCGKCGVKLK